MMAAIPTLKRNQVPSADAVEIAAIRQAWPTLHPVEKILVLRMVQSLGKRYLATATPLRQS